VYSCLERSPRIRVFHTFSLQPIPFTTVMTKDHSATDLAGEIPAYKRGDLDPVRFAAVDAWLAQLPIAEQERLLAAGSEPAPSYAGVTEERPAFAAQGGGSRYRIEGELGRGGMGLVYAGTDVHLGRPIAIKVLRPRDPTESLAAYTVREQWFSREALLLAGLDHPGIVSIHDVGRGPHGEPAYIMRRLDGAPVRTLVSAAAAGHGPSPAQAAGIILRAAEAVGAAHARGIIHRDLKPDNIWAAPHGEVVVIDWGLAVRRGEVVPGETHAGTVSWSAPEQQHGASGDPRADVYALGCVLNALLTGTPDGAKPRAIPRGLAAVIRRCLAQDPQQRYADGDALAADLARWFAAGITHAEQPAWPRRAWAWIRLHPGRSVSAAMLVVGLLGMGAVFLVQRAHRERILAGELTRLFAETDLEQDGALVNARRQLDAWTEDYGPTPDLRAATERLTIAESLREAQRASDMQQRRLTELARRYDRTGPWPGETAALRAGLADAGIIPGDPDADERLRRHPAALHLRIALTHLARALILEQAPEAERRAVTVLISSGGSPAWQAMGNLLAITETRAHDLVFCNCEDSEIVLSDPVTTALLLALFGPAPRLVASAHALLAQNPGALWPRIILARVALTDHDPATATRHAWIALGAEPQSLWPALALAYAAVLTHDREQLAEAVALASRANAQHAEVILLQAVAAAWNGDIAAAQLLAEQVGGAHIRYHLDHPVGHPMEWSAQALVAAQVPLSAATPVLGPLVPHH